MVKTWQGDLGRVDDNIKTVQLDVVGRGHNIEINAHSAAEDELLEIRRDAEVVVARNDIRRQELGLERVSHAATKGQMRLQQKWSCSVRL